MSANFAVEIPRFFNCNVSLAISIPESSTLTDNAEPLPPERPSPATDVAIFADVTAFDCILSDVTALDAILTAETLDAPNLADVTEESDRLAVATANAAISLPVT